MNLSHDKRFFRLASPYVLALLMFGCSGSSDSPSSDIDGNDTPSGGSTDVVLSDDQESGNTEPTLPNDTPNDTPDDSADDGQDDTDIDSAEPETPPAQDDSSSEPDPVDTPDADPVVADPVVPDSVQVRFDITVPVYQSDQLRVEVDWGDINLAATWIGDEYWSATGEFPLNTQHNVSVTFYDWNGGIELARFSDPLTTGFTEDFNSAQPITISADDFDSEIFDNDADGTSNLDELVAGRNPLVDEDAELPVSDSFVLSDLSRMSVSRHFESYILEERPLSVISETNGGFRPTIFTNIEIDAGGNGTLTRNALPGSTSHQASGIRTVTGNAVTWEGSIGAQDDYSHSVSVNNTVAYIDETSRSFVEDVVGSNVGTYTDRWETSANLIGQRVDDGPFCAPVAGTVLISYSSNRSADSDYTRTITKELDDPYWRVSDERVDGSTSESFARELIMLRSYCGTRCGTYTLTRPEDKYFQCDFVDFED